jgi:hypothetical protein
MLALCCALVCAVAFAAVRCVGSMQLRRLSLSHRDEPSLTRPSSRERRRRTCEPTHTTMTDPVYASTYFDEDEAQLMNSSRDDVEMTRDDQPAHQPQQPPSQQYDHTPMQPTPHAPYGVQSSYDFASSHEPEFEVSAYDPAYGEESCGQFEPHDTLDAEPITYRPHQHTAAGRSYVPAAVASSSYATQSTYGGGSAYGQQVSSFGGRGGVARGGRGAGRGGGRGRGGRGGPMVGGSIAAWQTAATYTGGGGRNNGEWSGGRGRGRGRGGGGRGGRGGRGGGGQQTGGGNSAYSDEPSVAGYTSVWKGQDQMQQEQEQEMGEGHTHSAAEQAARAILIDLTLSNSFFNVTVYWLLHLCDVIRPAFR